MFSVPHDFRIGCSALDGNPHRGEDHHSAGDLIETVNNKYLAILLFKHFEEIGRVLFPAIRQDRKPGRLIYNDQILIFV